MSQHILGFSGLKEICNTHPVFVHFPIALFPVTLLYYAIGIFGSKPDFLLVGRVSLYIAAAAGAATAVTGLQARRTIVFTSTLGKMVKTHQKIGIMIFLLAVALVVWSFFEDRNKPDGSMLFLIVLALVNYLTLQNSDIGSRMVYTQGAGVNLKTQKNEMRQEEREHIYSR
jgi:uncharacterized membrane protein